MSATPQSLAESMLESAIAVTCVELQMAITWDEQHACFDRLRDLIRQRTPAQVERMEAQRGLVISPRPVENPIAAKFHTL